MIVPHPLTHCTGCSDGEPAIILEHQFVGVVEGDTHGLRLILMVALDHAHEVPRGVVAVGHNKRALALLVPDPMKEAATNTGRYTELPRFDNDSADPAGLCALIVEQ